MKLSERIKVLYELGSFLELYCDSLKKIKLNEFYKKLEIAINDSILLNPYFEKENIIYNLNCWAKILQKSNLESFVSQHSFNDKVSNVGIIMAGNIPLVGFHDFICVFLSGNKSYIKLSSKDSSLFKFIIYFLINQYKEISKYVEVVENKLVNYDAIIATGNDLSANQFKKYFNTVPNIIRSSRHSIAILNGDESNDDLKKLSFDIFMYYGLGCRSVSKLYIPEKFDIDLIIDQLKSWKCVLNNSAYYNNYIYHKTIYLMKGEKIIDTGFVIIKESYEIGSPISTLFYERYNDKRELNKKLKQKQNKIQCVISNNIVENSTKFGSSQSPSIDDYADKINTMDFLLKLS